MQVIDAIAHAMKAEGIDVLFAYQLIHLLRQPPNSISAPSLCVKNVLACIWQTLIRVYLLETR